MENDPIKFTAVKWQCKFEFLIIVTITRSKWIFETSVFVLLPGSIVLLPVAQNYLFIYTQLEFQMSGSVATLTFFVCNSSFSSKFQTFTKHLRHDHCHLSSKCNYCQSTISNIWLAFGVWGLKRRCNPDSASVGMCKTCNSDETFRNIGSIDIETDDNLELFQVKRITLESMKTFEASSMTSSFETFSCHS